MGERLVALPEQLFGKPLRMRSPGCSAPRLASSIVPRGYTSISGRRELVTSALSDGFTKAPVWEDETPSLSPGMIARPSQILRGFPSVLPRAASCIGNSLSVYRFKPQPDRKCSCNLQIAIELQRGAGHVAPFRMAKKDFDVITNIAAKCKIDGKSRVLHADVDAGSSESASFTPRQESADGGRRSLHAGMMSCSTCPMNSRPCCCSGHRKRPPPVRSSDGSVCRLRLRRASGAHRGPSV
jgi:hypothetical protein